MDKLNPNLTPYSQQVRTRVCGICIKQGKLLLVGHQATINNQAFWAPPGGGLHYNETAVDCLKREMMEETGLDVEVGRFLFINEYLQPPLHAMEYFFEVHAIDGAVKAGTDPEAGQDKQIIEAVEFMSLTEINKIPISDKHRILHHLYSLDDLLGMENHFLR